MEAEAALATAADLQARLGELEAATRISPEDAARLKALAADIGKEEKALAELKRKSEGLSRKAEGLQRSIEEAGGEKLKRQRALCDKLQEVRAGGVGGGVRRVGDGARGLGACLGAWGEACNLCSRRAPHLHPHPHPPASPGHCRLRGRGHQEGGAGRRRRQAAGQAG